jgi:hypothetical protein
LLIRYQPSSISQMTTRADPACSMAGPLAAAEPAALGTLARQTLAAPVTAAVEILVAAEGVTNEPT